MSTILVATYTAAFASPDLIERAKDQRLSCPVYYDGALVAPVSGTDTVYDDTNATAATSAVTVAGGVAVYDLTAAAVPATKAPSQRWREEWALTFADGQVHTFRRDAHLCLRRLYPVTTVGDLTGRHHDLAQLVAAGKSVQVYLDGAWDTLIRKVLSDGRYPQQYMTPWSMADAHAALALHRLFLDVMLNAPGDGKYGALAELYKVEYADALTSLRATIDINEDNQAPGDDEEGQTGVPMITLGGSPSTWERRS